MPITRRQAAAALGRITSEKKAASSAKNARRATRIRMKTQTPEQRRALAQKAARARWGPPKKDADSEDP